MLMPPDGLRERDRPGWRHNIPSRAGPIPRRSRRGRRACASAGAGLGMRLGERDQRRRCRWHCRSRRCRCRRRSRRRRSGRDGPSARCRGHIRRAASRPAGRRSRSARRSGGSALSSAIEARAAPSGTARKPGCRAPRRQRVEILARRRRAAAARRRWSASRSPAIWSHAVVRRRRILGCGPVQDDLDDVPAVGGRRGVVDDQRGGGALPRRFLDICRSSGRNRSSPGR